MLDISLLRKDLGAIAQALAQRKFQLDTALFQQLEGDRKRLQTETEGLQNQRNTLSRDIGIAKAKGANVDTPMAAVATINQSLKSNEVALGALQQQLNDWLLKLPNLAADDVPIGPDESANQEVRRHGAVPSFAFPVRDHVDLGAALGMDFESAAVLSGARFVVLKGGIARLHRALSQLMLDHHIANGYTECYVPYIVNQASLTGTGQLPKFADDLFSLKVQGEGDDPRQWFLIPTSEVPLTNLVRDSIVNPALLPFKFAAHTPCFRAEAGSHGRDTRGMVRQHQFDKVEMVQITRASESEQAQQAMVSSAEAILQKLELPYRVIVLCSGDMGFAARKTYDLEVWLPAQNCYREISSISNCGDFQARRMQARTKVEGKMEFLHTLNGSGLAVGRSLVAVLENHQEADGRIRIPAALRPYMGGMEYLSPA